MKTGRRVGEDPEQASRFLILVFRGKFRQFPTEASVKKIISFEAGQKTASGYLATPDGQGPGVVVIHAWWGLNAFVKDFCKRLAREGFLALAPDLYGGRVAKTESAARQLRSKMDRTFVSRALVSAVDFLGQHDSATGEAVGVVGFSLGAFFGLWLATQRPKVSAVVTFYGDRQVDYAKTRAAYLAHFAEEDRFVSKASREAMEAAIRKAKREVVCYVYPGTTHWFFEKDRKDAYNAAAAGLAWKRTAAFLKERL
jgi:carboxymethylenebutenolidase